jgi:mono/diheme cytochrome c family protein
LALLVAFISVGFALLTGGAGDVPVGGEPAVRGSVVHESVGGEPAVRGSAGDAVAGEAVFRSSCAACHSVESDRGPAGLSGLFERESLASRGLPVTRENVRAQILDPVGRMPSFKSRLTDDELEDLLGYLETL